jgi:hypothetical protein
MRIRSISLSIFTPWTKVMDFTNFRSYSLFLFTLETKLERMIFQRLHRVFNDISVIFQSLILHRSPKTGNKT